MVEVVVSVMHASQNISNNLVGYLHLKTPFPTTYLLADVSNRQARRCLSLVIDHPNPHPLPDKHFHHLLPPLRQSVEDARLPVVTAAGGDGVEKGEERVKAEEGEEGGDDGDGALPADTVEGVLAPFVLVR